MKIKCEESKFNITQLLVRIVSIRQFNIKIPKVSVNNKHFNEHLKPN